MEAVQQRFVMPTLLADGSVAVRPAFAKHSFLVLLVWASARVTMAGGAILYCIGRGMSTLNRRRL